VKIRQEGAVLLAGVLARLPQHLFALVDARNGLEVWMLRDDVKPVSAPDADSKMDDSDGHADPLRN
jgi:hypothetical protein